jgi:hypothetical protein
MINNKMQAELDFIQGALKEDSGIAFGVSIAFFLPRISSASLFGDSSLLSCGEYSTVVQHLRYLPFPENIVQRTLLHLANNEDKCFLSFNFLSSNFLEYVTIIINYCAAIIGTLPTGYVRNVPLPQVPKRQRAKSHQVHKIPEYYKDAYLVPMYDTTCRLIESTAYAFSPAWHNIAINT